MKRMDCIINGKESKCENATCGKGREGMEEREVILKRDLVERKFKNSDVKRGGARGGGV